MLECAAGRFEVSSSIPVMWCQNCMPRPPCPCVIAQQQREHHLQQQQRAAAALVAVQQQQAQAAPPPVLMTAAEVARKAVASAAAPQHPVAVAITAAAAAVVVAKSPPSSAQQQQPALAPPPKYEDAPKHQEEVPPPHQNNNIQQQHQSWMKDANTICLQFKDCRIRGGPTDDFLKALCTRHGRVVNVLRKMGYAFVEFDSEAACSSALDARFFRLGGEDGVIGIKPKRVHCSNFFRGEQQQGVPRFIQRHGGGARGGGRRGGGAQ